MDESEANRSDHGSDNHTTDADSSRDGVASIPAFDELTDAARAFFTPELAAAILEKKLTDPSMFLSNLEDDEDNGIEGDHAETVTFSSDAAAQGDATVTFKRQQNGVKLLQAAEEGNVSLVLALLSVDRLLICVRDSDLYTPLHRASYNNHANVVKALLDHGADVGARTDEGWTPLHSAARWAALDAAKTLINDGGADINAVTNGHLTPLHVAVSSGEDNAPEMVRLLLSYPHVRWDAKTDGKQTALDLAKHVSAEMVQLFDRFSTSDWAPGLMQSKGGALLTSRGLARCLIAQRSRGFKFTRWQDIQRKIDEKEAKEKVTRKWLQKDMYIEREDAKRNLGYDNFNKLYGIRYLDWSPSHLRRAARYKLLQTAQYDQRFIPERHAVLGSELAAAHFIVHRGGAVKFVDDPVWYQKDEKSKDYRLPTKHQAGLYLDAIDACQMLLVWEGFDNLMRLQKLRFLSIANGPFINDWCLEKLHMFSKTLEFLDVSFCTRLSANGLSGLARLKKLKFVRMEGLDQIPPAELAKVALALEDALPQLSIVGLDYDKALDAVAREEKLLEDPNVVEDARGNLFAKDDVGEYFFLRGPGMAHEKPVVDEFGLPLVINQVLRDPPELPLDEVEKLNQLSDGKLKHQLIGSPSGTDIKLETERILAFEAHRLLKEKQQLPESALIPECMKHEPAKLSWTDRIRKYLPMGNEFEVNLPPLALQQLRAKQQQTEQLQLLSGEPQRLIAEESASEPLLIMPGESGNVHLSVGDNSQEGSAVNSEKSSNVEVKPLSSTMLKLLEDNPSLKNVVRSEPPKPRPPRVISKYMRHSS